MQCDVFTFTAYKSVVLGPRVSTGEPNRWEGLASLGAGPCQEFAGKPLAPTEGREEPSLEPQNTSPVYPAFLGNPDIPTGEIHTLRSGP